MYYMLYYLFGYKDQEFKKEGSSQVWPFHILYIVLSYVWREGASHNLGHYYIQILCCDCIQRIGVRPNGYSILPFYVVYLVGWEGRPKAYYNILLIIVVYYIWCSWGTGPRPTIEYHYFYYYTILFVCEGTALGLAWVVIIIFCAGAQLLYFVSVRVRDMLGHA